MASSGLCGHHTHGIHMQAKHHTNRTNLKKQKKNKTQPFSKKTHNQTKFSLLSCFCLSCCLFSILLFNSLIGLFSVSWKKALLEMGCVCSTDLLPSGG